MWKLARFIKPYWKIAAMAPLLLLIEVCTDLLQPMLIASIIDEGVVTGNLLHIQKTGALMFGVALIGLIGGIGCIYFSSIASQSFGADLRKDLFYTVQSFSFRILDRFKAGSLVTRLTNDVIQIQNIVMMGLRILIRAPLLAAGSIFMAFTISPSLALIFVAIIPILAASIYFIIRKGFPLFTKVQDKLDGVNTVIQENLTGIRVVKAFVRADYENKRFRKSNDELMDIAIKATRIIVMMMPVMMLILNTSIVIVLWYGGHQVWDNTIQVGELIAFLNYVTQVLISLMLVSMVLMSLSRAKASSERINEVFELKPEIANSEHARKDAIQAGKVVFDQVSFSYLADEPERVLKDISFTVLPGQTIAILGATGSGKTSLVNLISRLYDVDEGRVLIDGTDVRDIDLQHLRTQIAVVLQEAILFTGTIQENISFGKPDASLEQVEAAARAAQIHDYIIDLPAGYQTLIGQRGVNLSGGQKQRVSIARAILVQPTILIMDDSTSAVDLGTEYRIQQALKAQTKRSTSFIIAQRISSVLEADKIVVLDEGRLVAEGTHQELMASSRVYQDIYRSQLGKEDVVNG